MSALALAVVVLHGAVLALLLPLAGHRVHLLRLSRRPRPAGDLPFAPGVPVVAASNVALSGRGVPRFARAWPRVTVQLPVFNEVHVVERAIDAACRLSYPRDRLQVQVLDDSTDQTTPLAQRRARRWRCAGVDVSVLHRERRDGFKAGALAAGLERADGEFVLVLDADFVPGRNLLTTLLSSMADPGVGMVQARWDHLNDRHCRLARSQAVLLDGHFFVEQGGRYRGGRFFNFNGTAGLWRRRALTDAGGWQCDTLTEDLDVSYRAQMAGWRFVFREDVGVPAELPPTAGALLVQQRRWAQGGVQTARKLLPRLLRGSSSASVKLDAVAHLCGHFAHPLAVALSVLIVPAAAARRHLGLDRLWWLDAAVFLAAVGPFAVFYLAAARKRGRRWGAAARGAAGALALGAGLSLPLSRAVLRGLRSRRRDPFERTPKRGGLRRSDCYERPTGGFKGRGAALTAGAFMVLSGGVALAEGYWASLPFVALFATGHLSLALGRPAGRRARSSERRLPARRRFAHSHASHPSKLQTGSQTAARVQAG